MKIGKNIEELRIAQHIDPKVIANELHLSVDEYLAIEKDEIDITLNQLEVIAKVLSCLPTDLLQSDVPPGHIRNYFFNQDGNHNINIKVQGIDQEEIRNFYQDLYSDELKRIPKFEKLLRENGIHFDF
jgi:transcriptional regulator with XRE-family HTH domain